MYQFSKLIIYSLFMASICLFQIEVTGQEVFPEQLTEIANAYGCHEDKGHYEKNEKGVKPPYYWGVAKNLDPSLSVVFWCNYKEKDIEMSKIVIHIEQSAESEIPFSKCPSQIMSVIGSSTGVWVSNNAIYTGFEDGLYFYCEDGVWKEGEWH